MNFIILYFIYGYQAVLFGVSLYYTGVYFHDRKYLEHYVVKETRSFVFLIEIISVLFFITYILLTIYLVKVCRYLKNDVKIKEKNKKVYTNVKTVET